MDINECKKNIENKRCSKLKFICQPMMYMTIFLFKTLKKYFWYYQEGWPSGQDVRSLS